MFIFAFFGLILLSNGSAFSKDVIIKVPIPIVEYADILSGTIYYCNETQQVNNITINMMNVTLDNFYAYSGDSACQEIGKTCLKLQVYNEILNVWGDTNAECSYVTNSLDEIEMRFILEMIDDLSPISRSLSEGDFVGYTYRAVCDSRRVLSTR